MDSDVTYADLKFPTNNETAGKETGKSNISQRQNKVSSTKILIASALVICFLLISALIALIILYTQALSKFSLSETQMEELQHRYNKSLEYIQCKNITSGKYCHQYFQLICPEKWTLNNSRCYYFSPEIKTWDESRSACKEYQADLVIIDNWGIQEFIRSKMTKSSYWIGLTDQAEEGKWKWVNGVSWESKEFWACGQPDDRTDEDCATVGSENTCDQQMNGWNDLCCQNPLNFICGKEAKSKKKDFILPTTKQEL